MSKFELFNLAFLNIDYNGNLSTFKTILSDEPRYINKSILTDKNSIVCYGRRGQLEFYAEEAFRKQFEYKDVSFEQNGGKYNLSFLLNLITREMY
ncbi:MAG: hypothetical protein IPK10_17490 [Bacteroidetes bacterium]|nr:hypothetical protein [Bacteroidota bacterium]